MNERKYEALYIVAPSHGDAEVQAIADKFKGVVEAQGGKVEKAEKWEKRKLAYEVADFKEGNYVIMNFESDPKATAELKRQMRISDDVLRHIILRIEE